MDKPDTFMATDIANTYIIANMAATIARTIRHIVASIPIATMVVSDRIGCSHIVGRLDMGTAAGMNCMNPFA